MTAVKLLASQLNPNVTIIHAILFLFIVICEMSDPGAQKKVAQAATST